MNFGFTEEQDMLREAAKRFLEAECPPSFVRSMMADDSAHSLDLWKKIAGQGWLGILVPEAFGGSGGTFLDLAVVLEEMGKTLLPGPFFATVLLGGTAVLAAGTAAQKRELLPRLCSGSCLMTLALAEGGRFDAAGVTMPATRDGAAFRLSGEKLFVADAHVADRLVVAARTRQSRDPEAGITLFVLEGQAPGVTVTQLKTVDTTRRQCHVRFDGVTVDRRQVLGRVHHGWPVIRRVLDQATAGLCVEMLGTAQQALEMSVRHAKERVQFGKPIGGFQAVKHKCVDMLTAVENARALSYFAAWAVTEQSPDARSAVPMAKAYCSDHVKRVCSDAIQVHGGIGFTWEHDLHLFYRRALAGEASFGSAPLHRLAVADQLGA